MADISNVDFKFLMRILLKDRNYSYNNSYDDIYDVNLYDNYRNSITASQYISGSYVGINSSYGGNYSKYCVNPARFVELVQPILNDPDTSRTFSMEVGRWYYYYKGVACSAGDTGAYQYETGKYRRGVLQSPTFQTNTFNVTWSGYSDSNYPDIVNFRRTGNNQYLDVIYPVGSVYISLQNKSPANFLGGIWQAIEGGVLYTTTSGVNGNKSSGVDQVTLTTKNIPKHTHKYTPEGDISEVSTQHVHDYTHKHDTEDHNHTYTPEGDVDVHGGNKSAELISKLAAGFVPTFSAADETIFTLEDYEGKAYSTGDRNVYTDKRKQQKLIMNTAEIMRTANWTFTGKEKKTEDTNVCVKTHEANTGEMSANDKHKHVFTGKTKDTESVGNTEAFSILPKHINVYAWTRIS